MLVTTIPAAAAPVRCQQPAQHREGVCGAATRFVTRDAATGQPGPGICLPCVEVARKASNAEAERSQAAAAGVSLAEYRRSRNAAEALGGRGNIVRRTP